MAFVTFPSFAGHFLFQAQFVSSFILSPRAGIRMSETRVIAPRSAARPGRRFRAPHGRPSKGNPTSAPSFSILPIVPRICSQISV